MAKKHIEKKEVRRKFQVELTEKEQIEYGAKAAELESDIQKEEEKIVDLKEKQKAHKSLITECSKERRRLLNAVKSGVEMRELEAVEVKDFDAGKIKYMVNGKCLDEREMTGEETQLTMNGLDKSKKRKEEAKKEVEQSEVEKKLRSEAEAFNSKKKGKGVTKKSVSPLTSSQVV